jgi:gamma-glutamyltranspeptidase/glutathione hydrolase
VRNAVLADPGQVEVPVDWLLSEELASQLRARIDLARRSPDRYCAQGPEHRDTVYISVIDKHRNVASFINSLFAPYGSGLVSPKAGVLLQNRGEGFTLAKGHPNEIAPGKRPLHTIIPGMVLKGGRPLMSFGVMGGHYQAFGHAYLLSRVLGSGMDPQSAMELPRFFPIPGTDTVEIEDTMPAEMCLGLQQLGHSLVRPARPIGGAQVVMIDWENGTLLGASDPRKDGCALGTI